MQGSSSAGKYSFLIFSVGVTRAGASGYLGNTDTEAAEVSIKEGGGKVSEGGFARCRGSCCWVFRVVG